MRTDDVEIYDDNEGPEGVLLANYVVGIVGFFASHLDIYPDYLKDSSVDLLAILRADKRYLQDLLDIKCDSPKSPKKETITEDRVPSPEIANILRRLRNVVIDDYGLHIDVSDIDRIDRKNPALNALVNIFLLSALVCARHTYLENMLETLGPDEEDQEPVEEAFEEGSLAEFVGEYIDETVEEAVEDLRFGTIANLGKLITSHLVEDAEAPLYVQEAATTNRDLAGDSLDDSDEGRDFRLSQMIRWYLPLLGNLGVSVELVDHINPEDGSNDPTFAVQFLDYSEPFPQMLI